MTKIGKIKKIHSPSKHEYLKTVFILVISGLAIIFIGSGFKNDTIWIEVFHGVGGALIGIGLVEVVHENFTAKHVRAEFQILGDFLEKGAERICTSEEITLEVPNIIRSTKFIKVLGIGNSWLLKDSNLNLLKKHLNDGKSAKILIPNPLSIEIIERYKNDEPATFELDLGGLAEFAIDWYELMKEYESLEVRLYDGYPVVNMSVYQDYLFASPVLFKRRGKDSLTAVFKRPSKGSSIYEENFDNLFELGSNDISEDYINLISGMIKKGLFKEEIYVITDKLKERLSEEFINIIADKL